MNKLYKIGFMVCMIAVLLLGCADDGEFDHPLVRDNIPAVPVTFTGAITHGANPYYSIPYTGGATAIQLVISIPANSERQIKTITKMIAGATGITPGNVIDVAVPNYLAGPITVNGNSTTINTTITEFNTKVPASARITAAPAAGTFAERAFLFLITLDDNSTIVTQQCRIRVVP